MKKFYIYEAENLLEGVFPYDYLDSLMKLIETALPPKNIFFNKLQNCNIINDD